MARGSVRGGAVGVARDWVGGGLISLSVQVTRKVCGFDEEEWMGKWCGFCLTKRVFGVMFQWLATRGQK